MTCTHISQARIKLHNLIGELRNSGSELYENSGPWADPNSIDTNKEGFFKVKYWSSWTSKTLRIINKNEIEKKVKKIDDLLNSCNCYENKSSERSELIKFHQEERRNTQAQIDNMRSGYEKVIENQQSLIETQRRENSIVRKENSDLQRLLGLSEAQAQQLEIRLTEKVNALKSREEELIGIRQAFQQLLVSNTRNETEVRLVRESLDWTRKQLEKDNERVKNTENKLERKDQKLEEVQGLLTNLRITYETEKRQLENELKESRKNNEKLQSSSEQSHEKLLKERLNLKEEKIEEWAEKHNIELKQLKNLQRIFEVLIEARKNRNQQEIYNNDAKVTKFKQALLGKGIKIKEAQKICRKCEKIAEINLELGFKTTSSQQTQQNSNAYANANYNSYSSCRSDKNWKNINRNFTPELIQEWQNYGFTYEQCADWININCPEKQDKAVKEPVYYVWLRDVKQVDSEEVLNFGDEKELKKEYQEWLNQQQFETRQEVPPRF